MPVRLSRGFAAYPRILIQFAGNLGQICGLPSRLSTAGRCHVEIARGSERDRKSILCSLPTGCGCPEDGEARGAGRGRSLYFGEPIDATTHAVSLQPSGTSRGCLLAIAWRSLAHGRHRLRRHRCAARRSCRRYPTARPFVVSINGRKTLPTEYDATGTADAGHQVNGMGTGHPDRRARLHHHQLPRRRRREADSSHLGRRIPRSSPSWSPTIRKTDLAIIKIPERRHYPVIHVGTSRDAMPGETVIAVGNAYGYEHTVTQGIISALHRTVQVSDDQKYADLIQTDASINPGNSGGPLLNIDGDMIGINVAVRVGAQGIGFAIPVDEAMDIAANMLTCSSASPECRMAPAEDRVRRRSRTRRGGVGRVGRAGRGRRTARR